MSTLWRGWTLSIGYYRILNDYFNIVNKSQLEQQPWELPSTTSAVSISAQAFQPEPARTTPGLGVHLRTHANPFLLPQLEVSPETDRQVPLDKQENHTENHGKAGVCKEVGHLPWAEE